MLLRLGIISTLATALGAPIAGAEVPYWQTEAFDAETKACFANNDKACIFDNMMLYMEGEISLGVTCATHGTGQDAGSACGFAMVILRGYAFDAMLGATPERRREIAERFVRFLDDYNVAELFQIVPSDAVVLIVLFGHALRMDACNTLADSVCQVESAVNIMALIGDRNPESLDELAQTEARLDLLPQDLDAIIRDARDLTEGTQP